MSTDAHFLAAVTAAPADRLPRLVYADWLDEQGDARGQYLRLDDALHDLSPTDEQFWQQHAKRERLTDDIAPEWLAVIQHGTAPVFAHLWPADTSGRWRVIWAAHERWTGEAVPSAPRPGWAEYERATHVNGRRNPFADAAGADDESDPVFVWLFPARGDEFTFWCVRREELHTPDPPVWKCRSVDDILPPITLEPVEEGPRLSELVLLELLDRAYPTGGMTSADVLDPAELHAELVAHFGPPTEFAGRQVYERDGVVVLVRPPTEPDGRERLTAYARAGVQPPGVLFGVWGRSGGEMAGVFIPEPFRPPVEEGQMPPRVSRWRIASDAFTRGEGNGFDMAGKSGDDSTAVPWWKWSAAAGHDIAARNLSVIFNRNNGVPPDVAEHRFWMRRAALLGDAQAMYHLGNWAQVGHHEPKDLAAAEKWYRRSADAGCEDGEYGLYIVLEKRGEIEQSLVHLRRAADAGHSRARTFLANRLESGKDGPADFEQALELFRAAAEQGEANALYRLGQLHAYGPEHLRDPAESERCYRLAAEAGSAAACFNLGLAFGGEHDYRTDADEQAKWFERAGALGKAEGYFNLGILHQEGIGRPVDRVTGLDWFRKAAAGGHAESARTLGNAYREGKHVPRDYTEALRWYRQSADAGVADAIHAVGLHFLWGQGVAWDPAEAMRWFRRAADAGCGLAHYQIAQMYQGGFGVAREPAVAADWCHSAIEHGETRGYAVLGELYRDGLNGPPDMELALKTWLAGVQCDPPVGDCTYHVALALFDGNGLPQDEEKAHDWLYRAVEEGSTEADVEYSCQDLAGETTADELARAVEAFGWAAHNGSARGCFELGKLCEAGRGVPKDVERAKALYLSAVRGGWAEAQERLTALERPIPVARRAIPVARRVDPKPPG